MVHSKKWTQSISSPGYAIMDGELRLTNDHGVADKKISLWVDTLRIMEDDIRPIFEKMRDSRMSLATWEMKSLDSGPREVMSAVRRLGDFQWTFCTTNCQSHERESGKVGQVKVGQDARRPPWSLPSLAGAGPSLPLPPRLGRDPSSSLFSLSPLSPLTSEDETPTSAENTGKKRKRDNGSPAQDNGKRCKREDDEEENVDVDEAYQDRYDVSVHDLVQQVWAQATRVDGTIIVLHSGNHELICVRHRDSQTLYVSDVIEPHRCINPGYGKIQVGIYLAAVQDATDRVQQQLQHLPVSQLAPPGGGAGNDLGAGSDHERSPGYRGGKPEQGVRRSHRLQGRGGGKGPDDKLEKMIRESSQCDNILMYLRYHVYDSPIPALLVRSPPITTHTRRQTPHPYSPEKHLALVVTSEIGRGATGVVHRGTLMPRFGDSDAIPMDVVIKLAFDVQQQEALRNEYKVYCYLRSKGIRQGIATVLGLFEGPEDDICGLVMLYAGTPLSSHSQANLSKSDWESTLSTLKSIHRAGILHRDIRLQNLLVSDSGITIIDFGHSEPCDDKRAQDKEIALLRHLLQQVTRG